jgi:hypothetical protein
VSLQEGEEGNQRGGGGLFVGVERARNGQAFTRIDGGVTAGRDSVSGVISGRRKEKI